MTLSESHSLWSPDGSICTLDWWMLSCDVSSLCSYQAAQHYEVPWSYAGHLDTKVPTHFGPFILCLVSLSISLSLSKASKHLEVPHVHYRRGNKNLCLSHLLLQSVSTIFPTLCWMWPWGGQLQPPPQSLWSLSCVFLLFWSFRSKGKYFSLFSVSNLGVQLQFAYNNQPNLYVNRS